MEFLRNEIERQDWGNHIKIPRKILAKVYLINIGNSNYSGVAAAVWQQLLLISGGGCLATAIY